MSSLREAAGRFLRRLPWLRGLRHRVRLWRHGASGRAVLQAAARKRKPRILFYQLSGLCYGGTEKNLQIVAKHLPAEKYDVYFLFSTQPREYLFGPGKLDHRLPYMLESHVHLLPFTFDRYDLDPPHLIHGMSPSITDVLRLYQIDLLVTAPAGVAYEFPLCAIPDTPIIILNIFGSTYYQENMAWHVCISHEVADKAAVAVPREKLAVQYIPTEGPLPGSEEAGLALRRRLGIPEEDIVFGRIGRATDGIFDPIGIRAFQQVVRTHPWIHYLIMSPMPILRQIVADEQIPNVHLLPPSGDERDVWAFHQAQDVMAHFRRDGESCGLNIGEAMLCGKPVISHRSPQWNAHTEYLDPDGSIVVDVDDVAGYAAAMAELAEDRTKARIQAMGQRARQRAESLFLIDHTIKEFEELVDASLAPSNSARRGNDPAT